MVDDGRLLQAMITRSRAVKIANCSSHDQSIKIGTRLPYTIKIIFKTGANIFEGEMTSY